MQEGSRNWWWRAGGIGVVDLSETDERRLEGVGWTSVGGTGVGGTGVGRLSTTSIQPSPSVDLSHTSSNGVLVP